MLQDGAAASEGPKRRKRKRSSGAQLKELGLTSDDDSDDDEWGSSDDEDDDEGEADFEEDGVAGPMGATHPPPSVSCRNHAVVPPGASGIYRLPMKNSNFSDGSSLLVPQSGHI